MRLTIKDSLDDIHYPVTVLANQALPPNGNFSDTEDRLRRSLAELSTNEFISRCDFRLLQMNDVAWGDDLLNHIDDEAGLVIMYQDTKCCKISKIYSPDEVKKLRIMRNVGALLYAWCVIGEDVTIPELLDEQRINDAQMIEGLEPQMIDEITMLESQHCLEQSEKLALYLFKGIEAPAVMQLIGRARAVTFAAVDAGSGQDIDLSEEDQYYDHLLLWDKVNQCLIGAYRIGFSREIIENYGTSGIYLDHVFEFGEEFHCKMGNAMELSRSFILPAYQKNPQMLDMLWKGLAIAAKMKNCFTLYGSVTISASYTPLSQAVLVETLDRYHSDDSELRKLVTAKNPFIPKTKHHGLVANTWSEMGLNKLNSLIQELEADQRSIPPLIRYYVSLGAKFLSFQVEASFSNAIYCLLKVDLKSLPRRYKKRFLGE